jgi:membrane glycosyltransferase
MIKSYDILFWVSGLCLGLMVCAYISCPLWKIAVPSMLALTIATAKIGIDQKKKQEDG